MKLLLLLLLLTDTAHAQSRKSQAPYAASRIALYSGLGFDLGTTETNLRAGGVELNPVLGQNPYRRVGFSIGTTVAADLATRWLKNNGHPKAASIVNFAFASVHFSCGIHNVRGARPSTP